MSPSAFTLLCQRVIANHHARWYLCTSITPISIYTQNIDTSQPTIIAPPISTMQRDMGCQDQLDILDRTTSKRVIPPYGITWEKRTQEDMMNMRNDSTLFSHYFKFTITYVPL